MHLSTCLLNSWEYPYRVLFSRCAFKLILISLLIFGITQYNIIYNVITYFTREVHYSTLNPVASTRKEGYPMRVIVPTLKYSRRPIENSLINIAKIKFGDCPQGWFSRYLRVIIQQEWETNITNAEPQNNSGAPLILYGNTQSIFHTINSTGCRYVCQYSTDVRDYPKATLAVYTRWWGRKFVRFHDRKMWAFETNESPVNIWMPKKNFDWKFRIFVTHSTDSLVPWVYGFFLPFNRSHCLIPQETRDFMATEDSRLYLPVHHKERTKLAAWVVTNVIETQRREYVFHGLSNFIQIDRYGGQGISCGPLQDDTCFQRLSKKYKFVLAFENSYCREYITEKLFKNALGNEMVPIVFGAPGDDYYELAPPNSYIDVNDFPSLEDLARYLKWLDKNDTAYASYFAWKKYGHLAKKPRIDCRLCGVLHGVIDGNLVDQTNQFQNFTDKNALCQI